MGGNSFDSKNEGNGAMNTGDNNENGTEKQAASNETPATETPASSDTPASGDQPAPEAASTEEGPSVETGDATQGGQPEAASTETAAAPAEGNEVTGIPNTTSEPAAPAADAQHEMVSGIQVRVTGAVKGQQILPPDTKIGDALKAMGVSAPSNYTLRDEVTSSVLKLQDPISSLSKGATITSSAKGSASQEGAGITATRRASGG